MTDTTWQIRPGYIVVDVSTAAGGVHYDRRPISSETINGGAGMRAEHVTVKTVDHVEIVAAIDALVKKADYACRKHCVQTGFGWFADDETLPGLRGEIAELQVEGRELNARAAALGSARRARVGVVLARLEVSPEAAQEVARVVRERLTELRDALRSGEVKAIRLATGTVRGLDRLAVGFQGDAIRFGLECAANARSILKSTLKDDPEKRTPAEIGASLDLEALESAIALFSSRTEGPGMDISEEAA